MLPETNIGSAQEMSERLRMLSTENQTLSEKGPVSITISLGCAEYGNAETIVMLSDLLQVVGGDDMLVIKACVEGLLLLDEVEGGDVIRHKLTQTDDEEVRFMISHLMHRQSQ